MKDPWILCVDDEPRILSGMQLTLGIDYNVMTASSGKQALKMLATYPNCALIISDMRMPEMNGAQLLSQVLIESPNTSRVLLTGFAELDTAIQAINDGQVSRFLTKPCRDKHLRKVVDDALELARLRDAEAELLDKTVNGIVEALVEVAAMALPSGIGDMVRGRELVRGMRAALGCEPSWEVEATVMLAKIGYLALPAETIEKYINKEDVGPVERSQLAGVGITSAGVLARIPRFERVAALCAEIRVSSSKDSINDHAQICTVLAFLDYEMRGYSRAQTMEYLHSRFASSLVDALAPLLPSSDAVQLRMLLVEELAPGDVMQADAITNSGAVILRAGATLTPLLIDRLRNFSAGQGIQQPLHVWTANEPKPDRY